MSATSPSARNNRNRAPGTRENLKRIPGGEGGPLGGFLDPLSLSVDRLFDDFDGLAIDTFKWATSKDGTGTAFAFPANPLSEASCVQATTSTTSGEGIEIHGAAHWLGDRNCLMEVRFQIDVVTTLRLELGFANIRTAATTAVVSDVDTPTIANGATNLAVVHMDTSQTLTTMAFVTDGSTTGQNPTKTNLGTRVPTAAAWMTARVGLVDDTAFCQLYNSDDPQSLGLLEEAQHGDALASQVEGGTLMMPFFLVETLTTAARIVQLDYLLVTQDR